MNERELEFFIKTWTLIPSKGGVFEFKVNGELLFSKKALKRHAEPGEIRAMLKQKVDQIKPPGFVIPDDD